MPSAVARQEKNALGQRPAPSSRAEVLLRHRHLREISKQHLEEVQNHLAGETVLRQARRLGLAFGREFILDREDDINYALDLAIHTALPGRSRAIDRYARASKFAPNSDEALVLEAMQNAQFAILHVERRHQAAGLIVTDLLRRKEIWLVDEGMERSFSNLEIVATRLYAPEAFSMTAGVLVPIDMGLLEHMLDEMPQLGAKELEEAADDRRLAETLYRVAIETGVTGRVRYQKPGGEVG
jgi:hypothetical protein